MLTAAFLKWLLNTAYTVCHSSISCLICQLVCVYITHVHVLEHVLQH